MFQARLHIKFLVLVLGTLFLFFGLLSIVLVKRETAMLEKKADDEQQTIALTIYSHLKESMLEGTPRNTLKLMDRLRGTKGLVHLQILRSDGSNAFGLAGARFDVPQLEHVFTTGEQVSFRQDVPHPMHTILYPLRNEQACVACHTGRNPILGVLLVALSTEDSDQAIAGSVKQIALFLGGLILLVGAVLYLLVRKVILRPLAVLYAGAERIGRGDLSHRIALSTGDEIQDLAQSFNEMADHVEDTYTGLELMVRERTSQMEKRARQLYEYSRSMAAISRLSTKVFNAEQTIDSMLDRFIWAVSQGLGYEKAMLFLVDRKQALLEVKRETGFAGLFTFSTQPLSGSDPFAEAVRTGSELHIPDVSRDPMFRRYLRDAGNGTGAIALYIVPILTVAQERVCWQAKNCIRTDCPAYRLTDQKCWLVRNTLCGNDLIESYGDKLSYCMSCEVFPVLGVLMVAASADRPFRRRNVSALRILAAEMGAALENHRLYDYNRALVRELLELHKVTASALAELSLERTLDAFTESALKFSWLDACNFWLLSADGRQLLHKAGRCRGSELDGFCSDPLPVDRGLLGRAFCQNSVLTEYHAVYNDPTPLAAAAEARGLQSLLALPLFSEARPIGVFSIHKRGGTPFLDAEIAAFMLLANHAAMAINVCLLNQELREQNQELTRSTNIMGGILASMTSGVMLLDLEGTVQLVNDRGAALMGSTARDMMGRPLQVVVPDAAGLTASIGPYKEMDIQRRDGSVFPLGFSSTYYHGILGARQGIVVVFRDLTEIKVLQAEVLNKERFAAMGRVVAGVAHEIRNPLFGISSIGQIFERELADSAHRQLAQALMAETRRLNQLVEELLIYGRPMKLAPSWCDMMAFWQEVLAAHREELVQKGITIRTDFQEGQARAYIDKHQIRQVFLNLIRNAIDALPRGGEIAGKLLVEDDHLIIKINDTGTGIPAEHIDRVFDLFYTTKPKGSGLGLAICKKIIEDHGGSIQIESRQWEWQDEGSGTEVTIVLPHRHAAESMPARSPGIYEDSKPGSVSSHSTDK